MDTEHLREVAEKAAQRAGEFLKENLFRPHRISYKGEIDLVTEADLEADLEAEKLLLEVLKEETPEIPVLGEELSRINPQGLYWLVDPLNGTIPYAYGFPWFGASRVLLEDYPPLVGAYHPLPEERFSASKSRGAFLNGLPLKVSETEGLQKVLLATGIPYHIHRPEKVISAFKEFLARVRGTRRAGAASLDLAYVACGRLEGFEEALLKPWDTAAGVLWVEEAEGRVIARYGPEE